ncbi:MAG TPA: YeeE/YedE family protein [Epulopiscium sp.]|nr:YeeE/YedE family protein [Candidatus Epulonipiscium sp.]
MKKNEQVIGWIGVILVLVLGKTLLASDMLFFRLLIGVGFGYALSRSYSGFAGSVNRALNTGSTKLMRNLMGLFFFSALVTTGFLFKANPADYDLWINPINLGLIAGGILFGFGMSFSSCCASGVLTDLITGLPRALITLIFFGFGVFIAFPLQKTAGWVTNSWFSSPVGLEKSGGVFLPDLFKWDGAEGYIGALILTAIFCSIVIAFSYLYEKNRKQNKTYTGVLTENMQYAADTFDSKDYELLSETTYNRVFVKPWTLAQGFLVLGTLYTILMGVTKSGWGASTPYGLWFGKVLMVFGVSAESLAAYTKMPDTAFLTPFFQHGVSVQNFGILVGTTLFLLTAGQFKKTFMSELKITGKEALLYGLGGITMGVGTRLANGCNVGALYTPIANLSLAGWIFLIVMVIGGILGNMFAKKLVK